MSTWKACNPVVHRTRHGWLAVTPMGYPYRIGALGHTADDARERFSVRLEVWRHLHERAEAQKR
jgi:hypothetical protein